MFCAHSLVIDGGKDLDPSISDLSILSWFAAETLLSLISLLGGLPRFQRPSPEPRRCWDVGLRFLVPRLIGMPFAWSLTCNSGLSVEGCVRLARGWLVEGSEARPMRTTPVLKVAARSQAIGRRAYAPQTGPSCRGVVDVQSPASACFHSLAS